MTLYRCLLLLFVLLVGAVPCLADELVSFKAGYLVLTPDGSFAIDGQGIGGTRVDFQNDLDVADSEEFFAEAALQLGPFRLAASYLPVEFSGSETLDRTVFFNGASFDVNSKVHSRVALDLYECALAWYVLNFDDLPVRLQVGPELAVKLVDVSLSVQESGAGLSERESVTSVLPTVGVRARVGLADFLSFNGRLGYLGYDDSHVFDLDAQVEFSPVPLVGVFAGYRLLDLEVDDSGVFIDATLDGPYLGAMVRF